MMTYWILGFVAGLFVGIGLTIFANRNKCKHDWKLVRQLNYYDEGATHPAKVYDSYQCSKCKEYKKVRIG